MLNLISLAWIIFAAIVVAALIVSFIFTRYYTNRFENEKMPMVVNTISLSVMILSLGLVPIDVYSVSSTIDPATGASLFTQAEIDTRVHAVGIMYYVLFGLFLGLSLLVIPFAYFFYEEAGEDVPTRARVWAGFKFTILSVIIILILVLLGFFLNGKPPDDGSASGSEIINYVKHLLFSNRGEKALIFTIACFSLLGFVIWLTFTAYGLSALPLGLIKGRKAITSERVAAETDLATAKEQRRAIKARYLTGRKMTQRDKDQELLLKDKEDALTRRSRKLAEMDTCCNKCLKVFRPFYIIFGIALFLVALLVIVSLALTNSDKITNRIQGFVMKEFPQLWNPIDKLLQLSAHYFPLDFIFFGLLIIYFFFCTLAGILNIGIRFFWVKLFSIRARRTQPQGLLLATIILMFSMLALMVELLTLTPQYATYGTQTYKNATTGDILPCSLSANVTTCTQTQLATITNRISLNMSFFGVVWYYATWVFLGCWLIGLIVAICKGRAANVEEGSDSSSDEEEWQRKSYVSRERPPSRRTGSSRASARRKLRDTVGDTTDRV